MKKAPLLSTIVSLLICNIAIAQSPYATESNGDAMINPGGVYCIMGGTLRIEKAREGEGADIYLDPGRGCSSIHTGKIYLRGKTSVSGAMEISGDVHALNKVYAKSVEILDPVPRADYVFDDDYKLRPLNVLESYIQENRHLPDIPSAKQVSEKGYNVDEMNNRLLQKVEELTLYVIQQDKRIRELEAKQND